MTPLKLPTKLTLMLGVLLAFPVQGQTIYTQAPAPVLKSGKINSQFFAKDGGAASDVTSFDNFSLKTTSYISKVEWRGASSNKDLIGFTVKIYESINTKKSTPDIDNPLMVNSMIGTAKEEAVGANLSDYRMDLARPIALAGGQQYWISIVANMKSGANWGWASGTGGDGKSLQSKDGSKMLSVSDDRAFTVIDNSTYIPKK